MSTRPVVAELARRLARADRVLVLTGAGVSAESGVPTFRDALTGYWSRYRAEDLATETAFRREPVLVQRWYAERQRLLEKVRPNDGHRALTDLACLVPILTLVTQNVDGLHQRAGSEDVAELHGRLSVSRCIECGGVGESLEPTGDLPARCTDCGGLIRPGVVWFGEALPERALRDAEAAAERSDVALVVGTSGLVHPAAALPSMARAGGAYVAEINTARTPLSPDADVVLLGPSGTLLPALVEAVREVRRAG